MGSLSIWHWIIVAFVFLTLILIPIFYIKTYQKAAKAVNQKGGHGPVSSAWILLIPIISIPWFFVLLMKLKESIAESTLVYNKKSWWNFGLIAGLIYICAFLFGAFSNEIAAIFSVSWIVFATLHWSELSKLGSAASKS